MSVGSPILPSTKDKDIVIAPSASVLVSTSSAILPTIPLTTTITTLNSTTTTTINTNLNSNPSISISPTSPLLNQSSSSHSTVLLNGEGSSNIAGGGGGGGVEIPKKIVLLRRPNSTLVSTSSSIPVLSDSSNTINISKESILLSAEVNGKEVLTTQSVNSINQDQASTSSTIVSSSTPLVGEQEVTTTEIILNHALITALNHPRDRILLLRAELELELFLADPSRTRLPLSPPHFTPALNSYQRLLIHRLADTFGITREVEPVQGSIQWNNQGVAMPIGVVVLVKGINTKLPLRKLVTFVPHAPTSYPLQQQVSHSPTSSSVSISQPPSTSSTPLSISLAPSPSASPSPSPIPTLSPSHSVSFSSPISNIQSLPIIPISIPTPPPVQQIFKILPRASSSRGGTNSSASSSTGGRGDDDDRNGSGSNSGRRRREMSLEERELAYKEARERIFNLENDEKEKEKEVKKEAFELESVESSSNSGITRPNSEAGSTYSRASGGNLGINTGAASSPSTAYYSNLTSPVPSPTYSTHQQQYPQSRSMSANSSQANSGIGMLPSLRPSAPSFDPSNFGFFPQPQLQTQQSQQMSYEEWSRQQQQNQQQQNQQQQNQQNQTYLLQLRQQQLILQQQSQQLLEQQQQQLNSSYAAQIQQVTTGPQLIPQQVTWANRASTSQIISPPPIPSPISYPLTAYPLPPQSISSRSTTSTSNSGSDQYQNSSSSVHLPIIPPSIPIVWPAPKSAAASSINSSSAVVGDVKPGYIMRFAEGAAVYPTSSTSGSSSDGTSTSRSISGNTPSTSPSNLRSSLSDHGNQSKKIVGNHSATNSAISNQSQSTSNLSENWEGKSNSGHSATGSGGSGSRSRGGSSDKGKKVASSIADLVEKSKKSSGKKKVKEEVSLDGISIAPPHPSLPAKPTWVTTLPPVERTLSLSSGSTGGLGSSTYGSDKGSSVGGETSSSISIPISNYTPSPPATVMYNPSVYPTQQDTMLVYPSTYSPPVAAQLSSTITPQSFFPTHYQQSNLISPPPPPPTSGTMPSWWDPNLQPPSIMNPQEYYQQIPYPPPQHLAHPSLSQQQQLQESIYQQQQQLFYAQSLQQSQISPPMLEQSTPQSIYEQQQSILQQQENELMSMGEMRRPPPRSTELFDPSASRGGGGGSKVGTIKRTTSVPGSSRVVSASTGGVLSKDDSTLGIEKGVEGVRL